jgi:hypothetical protein
MHLLRPLDGIYPAGMVVFLMLCTVGFSKQSEAKTAAKTITPNLNNHQFIGTWQLVTSEFRAADGEVTYPLGEKAVGILIYDSGGRMAAQLMRRDRPKFASGDMRGGSSGEIKMAAEGYVAYFVTYHVDDKNGKVVHHVEASLFPNWLGQDQVRLFEFSADADVLTLRTLPILSGGHEITGVLVWKRLK